MMGLLGQSVLVSCIPECHSMPRFVIQRQSYGLGFGAFADAGKLDTLGGASSVVVLFPPPLGIMASHFVRAICCLGCAAKREFSLACSAMRPLYSLGKNQHCRLSNLPCEKCLGIRHSHLTQRRHDHIMR